MGCKGAKKRKEWETEKYKKHSRKIKRLTFTNKFFDIFLERSSEHEGNII